MNNQKERILPVVEVNGVTFSYDRQTVIEDINLSVPAGAFLGLVGPNGSGKSTLMKMILGLLKPDQGHVRLFDQDIKHFHDWSKIGFVSQKANSFNSGFPATVFEVVSMGLYGKMGLFRFMTKKYKDKVFEALKQVNMQDFAKINIGELSGGQQQRVFIARALVSEPDLLILDEPTVGVDAESVAYFYDMLKRLNRDRGITLVLVTHDVGAMTQYVTHVACLNKCIHFHGFTKDFEDNKDEMMTKMYGHDVKTIDHNHDHHDHDHFHDHDDVSR